jgi:mannose-6-phosphate isomerase-like protein (cupin superfamily)
LQGSVHFDLIDIPVRTSGPARSKVSTRTANGWMQAKGSHAGETEEFAIVVSGRFELVMEGMTRACNPGDHLVVEAGVEHAIRVIEPGRLVLIGRT